MNEGKRGFKVRHKRKVASIEPLKPRNKQNHDVLSAKANAAGPMKDKKKAMKQGDVKHKNKDYAESLEQALRNRLYENEMGAGDFGSAGQSDAVTPPIDEDDEAGGMMKHSLHTIARVAEYLDGKIEMDDDIPEWCAEKIGAAKGMLTAVMQYIVSDKEMQHDPDAIETDEEVIAPGITHQARHGTLKHTSSAMQEGAKVDRMKNYIKKSEIDAGHGADDAENIAWATLNKRGYLNNKNKKKHPKEGWTHDSLADELFEHERTYEDKLQNMLNSKLKK
jgi:hypothetical protein